MYKLTTVTPMPPSGGGRILCLDYARILVAILVIYGHLITNLSPERQYLYAFHMPFFFLISGMLHKYNGTLQWKKYVRILIYPFFWFNLLAWIIVVPLFYYGVKSGLFSYNSEIGIDIDGTLYESYIGLLCIKISHLSPINHPTWFLVALFYCKCLLDFIVTNKRNWVIISILYGLFFLLLIKGHRMRGLQIGNALMAFPYYGIGYYYRDRILRVVEDKRVIIALPFMIGAFMILSTINGRVSVMSVRYGILPLPFNIICYYLNAMIGALSVLIISSKIRYNNSIITSLANCLITTLCVQYFFMHLCLLTIGWNQPFFITFLLSVVIYGCCYYIHLLIVQIAPAMVGKK